MVVREGSIIIEYGSRFCIAGVADYTELPEIAVPSAALIDGKWVKPIDHGYIRDWQAFESLSKTIIKSLGIENFRSDNLILLSVPARWNRCDYEKIVQMFFETIDAPGICIFDQSLLALFACGLTTGFVVDIGYETTCITPIYDSQINYLSRQTINLGTKDVEMYAKQLLEKSLVPLNGISIEDVIKEMMKSEHFKFVPGAQVTEGNEKIEIQVNSTALSIPNWIFIEAGSVLFRPKVIGKEEMSIQNAMHLAMTEQVEPEKRPLYADNIVLAGGGADMNGLRESIEFEFAPYLSASETSHEFQPKEVRFAKIPEHMTSYKDLFSKLNFLGATVISKLTFMDYKNYITKADYKSSGPSIVHRK